ncbi:unnamed protein product, partial [Rangifer tarandus platyrhynchus]
TAHTSPLWPTKQTGEPPRRPRKEMLPAPRHLQSHLSAQPYLPCVRASRKRAAQKPPVPPNPSLLFELCRLVLAPDQPVGIRAALRLGTEKRPSRCLCQKPPHCLQGHSQGDAVAGSPGCDDVGLAGLPNEETGSAPGKPKTPQTNNHNRRNCKGY